MLHSGLVSISFRSLDPAAIIDLARQGRLRGIEWGGDVHVPHGDLERAHGVRRMTEDAGLLVASYGSYYRAADPSPENPDFEEVLASAKALHAPVVRVWCGRKGSKEADASYRGEVIEDLDRISRRAAADGVAVACEFHGGTLTDTNESALDLYDSVASGNLFPYWQPPVGRSQGYRLDGLRALLPTLCNLHVFYWREVDGKRERCALAEGEDVWLPFLELAAGTGRDHWAMLEFVRNDSAEQLLEDAATLNRWLEQVQA